jgi:hypothetical protein
MGTVALLYGCIRTQRRFHWLETIQETLEKSQKRPEFWVDPTDCERPAQKPSHHILIPYVERGRRPFNERD